MTGITNTPIGPMSNVYTDNTFIITKHSLPNEALIDVVNLNQGILTSDQAQFMIYRKGKVVGYDLEGNIFITRNSGDTTDTSVVALPTHGVMSIDANSEFYCVMKKDKKGVVRETLHLHNKHKKDITGKAGVLCLMEGEVLIHSHHSVEHELTVKPHTVKAPAFVRIVETDRILSHDIHKVSWAILVN